jgi:DNA-binding XRE family transcriptional regulator
LREIPPDLLTTIRGRRSRLGLGRDEVAQRVGCTERFIGYMERGERVPSPPLAKKIADVLDLDDTTAALWEACTGWRAR